MKREDGHACRRQTVLERIDALSDLLHTGKEDEDAKSSSGSESDDNIGKVGPTQDDLERAQTQHDLERTASRPIAPTRTKDGYILVDWYTTDDPENPQNWKNGKRAIVVLQI